MKLTCLACGQVNRVPEARLAAGPKCGTCGGKLIGGRVPEIDAATLDKAVRNDELPLVVDFWAAWCGPCRMMAPEFAKAAMALAPGVRLAKIDTEAHSDVSARFGIRGIPLLITFQGGREVARHAGRSRRPGSSGGCGAWWRSGLTRLQQLPSRSRSASTDGISRLRGARKPPSSARGGRKHRDAGRRVWAPRPRVDNAMVKALGAGVPMAEDR